MRVNELSGRDTVSKLVLWPRLKVFAANNLWSHDKGRSWGAIHQILQLTLLLSRIDQPQSTSKVLDSIQYVGW